jgi:hypothetical protein
MVTLNNTYGYKNFISDEEKNILLNWCENKKDSFTPNGNGRKFHIIKKDETIYDLVSTLKNKIIELDNIGEWVEDPTFNDYIGINLENAHIPPHTDPNVHGYVHTRYNVILKYPEEGGHSIYGGLTNILEENMVWKCVAGNVTHSSTPVIGNKPRITLSLGFQIKIINLI